MNYFNGLLIATMVTISFPVLAGNLTGDITLFPAGCQDTPDRICKLKGQLTFVSPRKDSKGKTVVWKTKEWNKFNGGKIGTTDGATIPRLAQPFIGKPYDKSYLKAAILHDHYCYDEGRVRTWQDTHLMFYDALTDLEVPDDKAKAMYFAVYSFGPKWWRKKILPGEICGEGCVYNLPISTKGRIASAISETTRRLGEFTTITRTQEDSYDSQEFDERFMMVQDVIKSDPDITLEELEVMARKLDPNNFPFE